MSATSEMSGPSTVSLLASLIAPGTVEEKIWELQQRKAQTISDVLGEEGFARNSAGLASDYWEVTREILTAAANASGCSA